MTSTLITRLRATILGLFLGLFLGLIALPAPALADDPPPTSQLSAVVLQSAFTKPDDHLAHNIPDLRLTIDGDRVTCGFLTHYQATGDLIRWGYATSEVLEERPGALTQYYQRGVVDCHQRNGAWLLERRLAWDYLGGGIAGSVDLGVEPHLLSEQPGLELGPWGHRVSNFAIDGTTTGFLDFFNALGGVQSFGYPKTDARADDDPRATLRIPGSTPGFIRQYFQAAVLEYHPGSAQPVKLGLLGDDVREILYPDHSYRALGSFASALPLEVGETYVPEGTTDRDALTALYHATGGPNWTNSGNWLSDAPIGEWHGVATDPGGRVVELRLRQNQLRGELPPQLGRLTRLQSLQLSGNHLERIRADLGYLDALSQFDLSANRLSGQIPLSLGQLPHLTVLNLANNQLSGAIPPELGQLANLTVLNLADNQLSGIIPWELGGLTNLTVLHLAGNQLYRHIPPTLGQLTDLTILNLAGNRLVEAIPGELGRLSRLAYLDLSANQLDGRVSGIFGNLPSLQVLRLGNNQFTGCLPGVLRRIGQHDLDQLGLHFCDALHSRSTVSSDREALIEIYHATGGPNWRYSTNWLSDKPLDQWIGVSAYSSGTVYQLRLPGNNLQGVFPAAIGHLESLKTLVMTENGLRGELPRSLANLQRLEMLELYNNNLQGNIPTWIGELKSLRALELGVNEFTGPIPAEIGNLANLTYLELSFNDLQGEIPASIGNLTRLTQLIAHRNHLQGAIPADLGRMSSVVIIKLYSNDLQGEIPHALANLANLIDLDLAYNRLHGEIPAILGNLSQINQIRISNNQLQGEIPAELGRLTNLLSVHIAGNSLTGCYPENFRKLLNHDLAQLGLPFCE